MVFFKLWFGIIVFGMANGFLLLPVMLSLWGPTEGFSDEGTNQAIHEEEEEEEKKSKAIEMKGNMIKPEDPEMQKGNKDFETTQKIMIHKNSEDCKEGGSQLLEQ